MRAGPSADELGQLDAQLANAQAVLDQAQAAYDQVKASANVGMLPQSLALQQATNQLSAANAARTRGDAHPTAAELAAATAQVQAAQAALDRLTPDPAQVQAALAAVESAKAQLAKLRAATGRTALCSRPGSRRPRPAAIWPPQQLTNATLVAPFAGTVMKLDIAPGEYAAPGAPVLLLADTSTWQSRDHGPDRAERGGGRRGHAGDADVRRHPRAGADGQVSAIKPYGETKQGDIVYTVTILLDQQDPRLRWNMTAKVTIG